MTTVTDTCLAGASGQSCAEDSCGRESGCCIAPQKALLHKCTTVPTSEVYAHAEEHDRQSTQNATALMHKP